MQEELLHPDRNGSTAVILETISKMSNDEQLKIYHQLGQWLNKNPEGVSVAENNRSPGSGFFESELGRFILAEADAKIPHEKIRETLSKLSGSFAQDIVADREER